MGVGPLVSEALRVVTGGNEQPRGGLGADTMVQSSTQRTLLRNVPDRLLVGGGRDQVAERG